MALEDFKADALRCTRCSYCKWIPFDLVKSHDYAKGCPSVDYNKFHSYSAGGRLVTMLSLMQGRSEVDDDVVDIAFKCQLCGNCDVACKVCRYDMEPLAGIKEFRRTLNEQGKVPAAYPKLIGNLRSAGNFAGLPQAARGGWSEGLGLKTLAPGGKAETLFHAGCRYSFDPTLRSAVQAAARVLTKGGVDFAIDPAEACCTGKAYDMGYRDDFAAGAKANLEKWAAAGVKTVVTPCATCFWTFKRLYPEAAAAAGLEVPEILHTTQMADRLLKAGSLEPARPVPLSVTYHDPCHLGRQGEDYQAWDGKEVKIYGQAVIYDPPRPRYNGAYGVYDAPRDVLKAIPGVELIEMERSREAAWCCGAGGNVREAYPEYNAWTAGVRVEEAKSTGAEALVSACSGCEKNFSEAVAAAAAAGEAAGDLQVLDVLELLERSL
jgi:Fe-S oxidoreductase